MKFFDTMSKGAESQIDHNESKFLANNCGEAPPIFQKYARQPPNVVQDQNFNKAPPQQAGPLFSNPN